MDEPLSEIHRFLTRPGLPPALLWVGAGASAAAGVPISAAGDR